jgi:hypothetical protein
MTTPRRKPGDVPWWVDLPTQRDVALQPRGQEDQPTEHCAVCGNAIKQMIYRGTGLCGDNCRKKKEEARTILQAEAEVMDEP